MNNLHNMIAYDDKNNVNSWKSKEIKKREPKNVPFQAMKPKWRPVCINKVRTF